VTEPVLDVRNLDGGYDGTQVLRGVTLSVRRAEILVVVGRSGCGKSTLLRYMLGLARPWAGSVYFEGHDIWDDDGRVLNDARQRWGVLFQSGALLASLTLLENVLLPLSEFTPLPSTVLRRTALWKLSLVGLAEFADAYPLEVSGGMQKRAGLARALALDPDLVFFDEPSAGLDPVTSAELDALIRSVNHTLGTTMVIVTHELPSILAIADRVIMLDASSQGIIAEGSPLELQEPTADPRVLAFFSRTPLATGASADVS
jgi:phospholipid/cholesterol/gamma-HCH transport system ATP-binding protein